MRYLKNHMNCLNKKPLILITNDDGIDSPGLSAAAQAAADFGDVLIAAPHIQQTGMGRAFPKEKDTGIIEERKIMLSGRSAAGYAVHGSPAQAVSYAVMELSDRKPDLCVSGINYGENPGMVLTCSGTLGAAFEAVSHGIPAIAVSAFVEYRKHRASDFSGYDWKAAQKAAAYFIRERLINGRFKDADVLNINVPAEISHPYTWRMTRQSRQNYFQFVPGKKRNLKEPYLLPSEIQFDIDSLEEYSDIYATCVEKIISVTPLSLDMTISSQIGRGGAIDESR